MELGNINPGLEFINNPAQSLVMSRLNSTILDLTRENDVLNQRNVNPAQQNEEIPELTGKGINVDIEV